MATLLLLHGLLGDLQIKDRDEHKETEGNAVRDETDNEPDLKAPGYVLVEQTFDLVCRDLVHVLVRARAPHLMTVAALLIIDSAKGEYAEEGHDTDAEDQLADDRG